MADPVKRNQGSSLASGKFVSLKWPWHDTMPLSKEALEKA
jgi:hypothetical protein